MKPKYTAEKLVASWQTALQEAIASDCDKVPAGYLRKAEWIKKGCSRGNVWKLEALGRMERKSFKVSVNGYPPRPTPHYRLV